MEIKKILSCLVCQSVLVNAEVNPSDLTERFNLQRKENLFYENSSRNLTLPEEVLEEEKEIEQLQEEITQPSQEKKEKCFVLQSITFDSNLENIEKKFSFLDAVLKKYLYRCVKQEDLVSLLAELKIKAIERGYITTLFGLKPQNLSGGHLEIVLETSLVGEIVVDDPSLIAFWGKEFGIKEGDVLNITPLERGIYNYKRLRTLTPRFYIQSLPSVDEISQTRIDIVHERKKLFGLPAPFYLFANLDNGGGRISGIYQTSIQAGLENLLSLNESFASYVVLTPEWKKDSHNLYASLDFSIPFRRFLFSMSGSYGLYAYPISFQGFSLKYHGKSGNLDIKGKILAYMDNLNQVSVSFGLGKRWAKNFLDTIELISQARNLTHIYASLDYQRYFQNSITLNLSVGVKQGLKFLGSMDNFPSKEKNPPNFFYTLPTLNAYVYAPFGWGDHRLVYTGLAKTQISRTQLYASEKMGLGGIYSVRGFDTTALSGDFGFLFRNDLTYYLPKVYGMSFAPSLGIDLGYVADIYTPSSLSLGNRGFLSGGGLGIKLGYQEYLQAQIWGYLPFNHPKQYKQRNFFFSIGVGL